MGFGCALQDCVQPATPGDTKESTPLELMRPSPEKEENLCLLVKLMGGQRQTYEKRSCRRWKREDLVRLFILVAASMIHLFLFSIETSLVLRQCWSTASWEALHLPGYITLAALFPTALWESVLSVHTVTLLKYTSNNKDGSLHADLKGDKWLPLAWEHL